MTLRLWSLLHNLHPRYFRQWRAVRTNSGSQWWEPLVFFGGIIFSCSACWLTLGTLNPLPFIFFTGTLIGVIPAAGISTLINNIRERGYYDLIAITPPGTAGLQWGLAAHFTRNNAIFQAMRRFLLMVQLFFFGFGAFSGMIYGIDSFSAFLDGRPIYASYLVSSAIGLLIAFFLRADYTYTILIGAFMGMLAPTYSSNRINASLIAVALFLGIQFTTLILFLIVWLMVESVDESGRILTFPVIIGWYLTIRELSMRALWWMMVDRLNTDEREWLANF